MKRNIYHRTGQQYVVLQTNLSLRGYFMNHADGKSHGNLKKFVSQMKYENGGNLCLQSMFMFLTL